MAEAPIVTVFRSRLRAGAGEEYARTADRMESLARAMPGFVDFKTFQAADGERVSIVVFDSPEAHAAWRHHDEHRQAQARGREALYERYHIRVCEQIDERSFAQA